MTDPTRDRPKTDQSGQNSAAGINLTNQSLTDADREALYPPSPYTDEQMQAINAASAAIRRFLDRSAPDVSRLVFNADCDEMVQVALAAVGLAPSGGRRLTRPTPHLDAVKADRDRAYRLLDQTRAALRVALHYLDENITLAPWSDRYKARARELAGCRIALKDATEAVEAADFATAPVVTHEWSVRYADGFVDGTRFTEAGARQRAAELGGEVVYRAVGPWQSAPTSEAAA